MNNNICAYFIYYSKTRYLARVVLVPFILQSGDVALDKLQKIHAQAVSSFPEVLTIGNFFGKL